LASALELFPECRREPVSFRFDFFLERILYHPEHGYYSQCPSFGKEGDFYTSPGVHSFFAEILAEQFLQGWEEESKPEFFTLLELGPGDATLASQLLTTIRDRFPDFCRSIRYLGLEVSSRLAAQQRQRLSQFENARIFCRHFSEIELEPFSGCIFSNEFFDALPFRRFQRGSSGWLECFVEISPNGIQEQWHGADVKPARFTSGKRQPPVETSSAALLFHKHPMPAGGIVEWRDQFQAFYQFASRVLRRGSMFHFDYGDLEENLDPMGTMRTFRRHHLGADPYVHLGEQDVTASVNFSQLLALGDSYGFESRLQGQREYLIDRGILQKIAVRFEGKTPEKHLREKLAIKNLIVPGGISDHFKVLIQRRIQNGTAKDAKSAKL
jgi:SAM-dependent MidA family methyltransferase